MLVTRKSILTGRVHTRDLPITQEQLWDIEAREKPIQLAAPYLTAEHREFLLTGITPDEWNQAMV